MSSVTSYVITYVITFVVLVQHMYQPIAALPVAKDAQETETTTLPPPEIIPETAAHYVRSMPKSYGYARLPPRVPRVIPPPVRGVAVRGPPHYYMYPRVYIRVPVNGYYWNPKSPKNPQSTLYEMDPGMGGYVDNLLPIFKKPVPAVRSSGTSDNNNPILESWLNQPSQWIWPDDQTSPPVQI